MSTDNSSVEERAQRRIDAFRQATLQGHLYALPEVGLPMGPAVNFSVNDHVWCPAVGLDGQILDIKGDRAQVWWPDDQASWEPIEVLRPPID